MAAAMIDMETLSTKLDTVILTLGGVKFNPYSKEEPFEPIYLRIDVDESTRHIQEVIPAVKSGAASNILLVANLLGI